MPIVPNFSTAQGLSVNSNVTFTDTSTGSDLGLTSRRIKIQLSNGKYLTTNGQFDAVTYETWAIGDLTLTLDLLDKSTVANVTVDWMTGGTATYTKTILCEWNLYDYLFQFGLLQVQTSKPDVLNDSDYLKSSYAFLLNLKNSETAVTLMDDLYSAQAALDKNYWMITHQNNYF